MPKTPKIPKTIPLTAPKAVPQGAFRGDAPGLVPRADQYRDAAGRVQRESPAMPGTGGTSHSAATNREQERH